MSSSLKVLYPRGLDSREFWQMTLWTKMFQLKSYSFCKISLLPMPIVYFCLADKNKIT